MSTLCKLCETKRAKRSCPGIQGEICPACCGAERENSIACPLECTYLQESRRHDRPVPLDEKSIPNMDVKLTEDFIEKREPMIMYLMVHLRLAMEKAGAGDHDAREALEALVQTYRTLQSGLIYESRSPNPFAAAIQEEVKRGIEEMRKKLDEEMGAQTLRDADVLGCLVFLQRLELQYDNGRRKSRAFLDFLRSSLPMNPIADAVAADEPRIQL